MRVYCAYCLGVFNTDRNDAYCLCDKCFVNLNQMMNSLVQDIIDGTDSITFSRYNGKH
jgi:hypothetical protein